MDLQIPHSLEIPQEGILQRKESGNRKSAATAARVEGSKNTGSGGMPGSYTHAGGDTAEDFGIELHGISEREEQHNAYEQFGELKHKYRSRKFWCKGYCEDMAGKNGRRIAEHIKNKLKQGEMGGQLTMSQVCPFRGGT